MTAVAERPYALSDGDFIQLPDLAASALGATVVHANDELFAAADNLISSGAATHDPSAFGPRGKVYDGWETRRRREDASDFVVIRLAAPAIVRGVDIDTSFFVGNFPPAASVEGATLLGYPAAAEVLAADWQPLIPKQALKGDDANRLPVEAADRLVTHVRLTIYPDGGVARFRVFGEVVPDPRRLGGRVDLAATLHGALIADCSNKFYAAPSNVLAPGRARVMSEGWETARRREAGNEWLDVRLGAPGRLHHAIIDTTCFVGNAPGLVRLTDAESGAELLPRTRLQPDTEHYFTLTCPDVVRAVRLDIYPDGGISRLRLHGVIPAESQPGIGDRWQQLLPQRARQTSDRSEFFS